MVASAIKTTYKLTFSVKHYLYSLLNSNSYNNIMFGLFQLAKSEPELSNMASIYIVDVDDDPVYTQYFDITLIPATIFFFNAQHMKVDWG